MRENFTETIQHNGNQCTLTNFSIKNNIFLNYCTEKDIFGLPRIFITYQDNDIDLVYNIKKSLDKHRQQSSSKHYRSDKLPENQNNTDTETSVEVSSDSDFSSTENAGVSESTRSNMEGGSSSLEEDMPGENSSEIDTSSSEVDSSEVSGEDKSSSNEPVVKDVEVVEKVSKPLIPQELDIEQVIFQGKLLAVWRRI